MSPLMSHPEPEDTVGYREICMAFVRCCCSCRRPPFAVLAAVLVFGLGGAVRGQESRSLKDRFLTEAPRAWEAYRSFAERLSGTIRENSTVMEPDGKVLQRAPWKYEI